MISLVLSMLAARRVQATVVLLLSAFATGAAVAGPVYLGAVDQAAVAGAVAESGRAERTVSLSTTGDTQRGAAGRFDEIGSTLLELPGFTQIYSVQFPVLGVESGADISWLVFREDVCPHLEMVSGRCLMAAGEVVLGEATARRLGMHAGTTVTLNAASYDEFSDRWLPDGTPAPFTVVGVYRPVDPTQLYWGRSTHFSPGVPDQVSEPVFTNRQSADGVDHQQDQRSIEAIAGPDALALERLPALRAALADLNHDLGGGLAPGLVLKLSSDLGGLLDRIDGDRSMARQLVPLAAVPLVTLCWFVIFLAVAYGTAARRHELSLVALRGVPRQFRWWLTAAESTVAILLGAPIGCLVGSTAVRLVAQSRFGTGVAGLDAAATAYALAAVAGAVLAGLLAQRRELASPVADLLRRVSARQGSWRPIAVEVIVAVLAMVAVLQLRGVDGEFIGLALLVPGLVALAVALVAARLLMPQAGRLGARALRQGRLSAALAARQLARRPGGHRLFVLLGVSVALLLFAAVAVDVAARARAERATVQTGADRILTVLPVHAGTLLHAVRSADPQGRYAMAAAVLPGNDGELSLLLTDTTRLARVAKWRPEFGAGASEVASRLRPPVTEPFVLRGTALALTVDNPGQPEGKRLRLTVVLRPLAGGAQIRAGLDELTPGRQTYKAAAAGCADGCRVVGIEAVYAWTGFVTDVLLRELREPISGKVAISQADFADEARWRGSTAEALRAEPAGLRMRVQGSDRFGTWALPTDAPDPLPVGTAGRLPISGRLPGVDAEPRVVSAVAWLNALPRLGGHGALADLEYADRIAIGADQLRTAEVWLTADAPADVVDRLRAQGLVVIGDRTSARSRMLLDDGPPALAIWFHLLAAAFAMVLAVGGMVLVAVVDRRWWVEDMRALRWQGVPQRVVGRAALGSYLSVVLAALGTGAVAAWAAWTLAGDRLPLFADSAFVLTPPRWPTPSAALLPLAVAAATFGATAVALAVSLRRAMRVRDYAAPRSSGIRRL